MEIGDCVLLMEGHTAAVTGLAVAEEGSLLVTSSADHTARVWGLDKGQCKAVLQGHTAAVNAVVVDTRGRFAVTASADATGRVWDLHSGQCAHVLRGHGAGAAGAGMKIHFNQQKKLYDSILPFHKKKNFFFYLVWCDAACDFRITAWCAGAGAWQASL